MASITWLYSNSIGAYMTLVTLTTSFNKDIGPSNSYSWIAPAWTVAASTGMVVAGALSDMFGRRWFCIGTGLIGMLACLVAGVSPSIPGGLCTSLEILIYYDSILTHSNCRLYSAWIEPSWRCKLLRSSCRTGLPQSPREDYRRHELRRMLLDRGQFVSRSSHDD